MISCVVKGVFKGGGFKPPPPPPPKFSISFLKIEGKAIERKRKRMDVGGGYLLANVWGLNFLEWGLDIFRGGEKFSGGVEKFSWGVEKFSGGG